MLSISVKSPEGRSEGRSIYVKSPEGRSEGRSSYVKSPEGRSIYVNSPEEKVYLCKVP